MALDFKTIRDDGQSELLEILDTLQGRKCLVLDTQLGGRLNHILADGSRLLKENGVVFFRELRAELGDFPIADGGDPDHILYLVRPSIAHMKLIASQIRTRIKQGAPEAFRYQVYFVPHKTLICEQVLEDEHVLHHIDIGEYHLDLIPFDGDLISLELESCFVEYKLDGDATLLHSVAQSLLKVQSFYGLIPNIKSIGPAARTVCSKMLRMRMEQFDAEDASAESEIDTLVLIDREVDLVSPLVTPLTYEGLIDELIGISNGYIKVDRSLIGDDKDGSTPGDSSGVDAAKQRTKVSVALNSNDQLYAEVRDLNVEKLGSFLGQKAKEIRGKYDTFRANKDASITEIHDFVKRIPGLTQNYKSLNQHINITELIKRTTDGSLFRQRWNTERTLLEGDACYDLLEEMIAMQQPANDVLRLLCLQSLTNGGIKYNKYDSLRKAIVQTYGFHMIFALNALEKIGMLRRREMAWMDSTSSWTTIRKALGLINENIDVHAPDDISYVSSGYAPLSVRLVEVAAKQGWASQSAALQLLPRPVIEFVQDAEPSELSHALQQGARAPLKARDSAAGGGASAPESPAAKKKVMMVYFIGGVTWMEIAALRFLNSRSDFPFTIVVATTKLVNGNTFLRAILPEVDNRLGK